MTSFSDSDIVRSWHTNAKAWAEAIKNQEIESRRLVTNQAILDAVMRISPQSLLDMGCGEGWMSHELAAKDMDVFGIDAIPALIEKAKASGEGKFDVCTYEDLPAYPFNRQFDCILCNFALIGKESTELVISTSRNLLKQNGTLLIQTLHPVIACGDLPYKDGWRPGSWAGFSKDFKDPAPWYFRTIESWCELFKNDNFHLLSIGEPLHPNTNKPASIIFECSIIE